VIGRGGHGGGILRDPFGINRNDLVSPETFAPGAAYMPPSGALCGVLDALRTRRYPSCTVLNC